LAKLRSETPTKADTERQHFTKQSMMNKITVGLGVFITRGILLYG